MMRGVKETQYDHRQRKLSCRPKIYTRSGMSGELEPEVNINDTSFASASLMIN